MQKRQAGFEEARCDVTVLLFYRAVQDPLPRINAWLSEQGYERGLVGVEDGSLPRDWYVTNGKGLECEVAVGAFHAFRLEAFVRFLRNQLWTDDEPYVQVCALRGGDNEFKLVPVWPLDYASSTLQSFGGVEVFEQELGPVVDPLVVITGEPTELAQTALNEVRCWLSENAPGSALRELPDPDITALGLYDYGRPKVGYAVTGTFGHGWCKSLADFLSSVGWTHDKGKIGVYLLTGSEVGWRTHTYIRPYGRHHGQPGHVSGWLLGMIRDIGAMAFAGGNRVAPLIDDLTRLDELCLCYAESRGYTWDRGVTDE